MPFTAPQSHSLPIVRRSASESLVGISLIEDEGVISINDRTYYWTAYRAFDRKAPQGQRVDWEVVLQTAATGRIVKGHDDARAAILAHFKTRIEQDNARQEAEAPVASQAELEVFARGLKADVDQRTAQGPVCIVDAKGTHPEALDRAVAEQFPIAKQVVTEADLPYLWVEAYGKVSGTTRIIPLRLNHLQAVADYRETPSALRSVLEDLQAGQEVHARVIRLRLVPAPVDPDGQPKAPEDHLAQRNASLASFAASRNALRQTTADALVFGAGAWRNVDGERIVRVSQADLHSVSEDSCWANPDRDPYLSETELVSIIGEAYEDARAGDPRNPFDFGTLSHEAYEKGAVEGQRAAVRCPEPAWKTEGLLKDLAASLRRPQDIFRRLAKPLASIRPLPVRSCA